MTDKFSQIFDVYLGDIQNVDITFFIDTIKHRADFNIKKIAKDSPGTVVTFLNVEDDYLIFRLERPYTREEVAAIKKRDDASAQAMEKRDREIFDSLKNKYSW